MLYEVQKLAEKSDLIIPLDQDQLERLAAHRIELIKLECSSYLGYELSFKDRTRIKKNIADIEQFFKDLFNR